MKNTLKKFWSHPMAPFAAVYYGGFAVATCVFGPVAVIHLAATTFILAAFLGSCRNSEVEAELSNMGSGTE